MDTAGHARIHAQLGQRAIDNLLVGNGLDQAGAQRGCRVALDHDVRLRWNDLLAAGNGRSTLQERASQGAERIEAPAGDATEADDGLVALPPQRGTTVTQIATTPVERRPEALPR